MNRRWLRLCTGLALILLMLVFAAGCTQRPVYTTVMGQVVDKAGNPVPGAGVLLGEAVDTTDATGRFYLKDVLTSEREVVVLVKGRRPEVIPVALGEGPQTLTLEITNAYRSARSGPIVDFVILLPSLSGTDLEYSSKLSFLTGDEVAKDARELLGITDLRESVEYLPPQDLAVVSDVLRTRNLVWISDELSHHLQVFNRETGRMSNLPFDKTTRFVDGQSRTVKAIGAVLERFLAQGPVEPEWNTPVIGHKKSKKYHREDANHLPDKHLQVYFPSREAAEAAGYSPDPICFGAAAEAANSQLDSDEARLARQVTAYIESRYRITYSGEDVQRIRRVAAPIIAVSERANLKFTFGILETSEYNAFALPGGYIFITRPLLDLLETESELAAVIAHEAVHITHMHAVKDYRRKIGAAVAAVFLAVATGDVERSFDLVDFFDGLITEGYSKSQEYDADRTGLKYMSKAGYDVRDMVTLLNKLLALERRLSGGRLYYSRTHPPTQARISQVEDGMRTVRYYQFLGEFL